MEIIRTRFKSLEDLVLFVSLSPQTYLNHIMRNGKHLYYYQMPLIGAHSINYALDSRSATGKYIACNRMTGKISFQDRPSFDAQCTDVPILEVESTNLIPADLE